MEFFWELSSGERISPVASMHAAHSHSQYTVLHATSNVLAMKVIKPCQRPSSSSISWSMEIICNHKRFDISLFFWLGGVPPCWRHPQIPSFTQTGMPNYEPFSTASFNHYFERNDNQTFNVYTESTLSLYKRACVVFSGFEICSGSFCVMN